jgi:hypothetical protein
VKGCLIRRSITIIESIEGLRFNRSSIVVIGDAIAVIVPIHTPVLILESVVILQFPLAEVKGICDAVPVLICVHHL